MKAQGEGEHSPAFCSAPLYPSEPGIGLEHNSCSVNWTWKHECKVCGAAQRLAGHKGSPRAPGSALPSQPDPSPGPHPARGSRGEWGVARAAGGEIWGPGVLALGGREGTGPGHAQSAQVRAAAAAGEEEGAVAAAAAAVRSRARAELRSPLAAAPGQPARGRAHKLPAAERGAASSARGPQRPPRGGGRLPDAPPADTDPRCKAGPQPLAPLARSRVSPASPLPNPGLEDVAAGYRAPAGKGHPHGRGASLEEEVPRPEERRGGASAHLAGICPERSCETPG